MLSQELRAAFAGRRPGPAYSFSPATTPLELTSFHAHAHILRSDVGHPLTPDLGSQGFVRLPDEGGFRSQFLDSYRSSDGISFKSAYMHVAGTRSAKIGYGWVTLATSVITGLNVRDLVVADLVFAQVSTEHPSEGYVPSVTFLGTRFENLRIAGRSVEPVFDLGMAGPKPDDDKPYLQDTGFLSRVSQQYERINNLPGLPDWARQQYHDSAAVGQKGKIECSLVTSVAQAALGTSFGHIVEVPGVGRVSLAKLAVDRAFHLTMVGLDQSPTGGGNVDAADATANGTTHPGGH